MPAPSLVRAPAPRVIGLKTVRLPGPPRTRLVSVPVTPVVASVNAGRVDYVAPTDKYLLKATDVTNAEYAAFLTWAKAQGYCAVSSGSVQGVGVE